MIDVPIDLEPTTATTAAMTVLGYSEMMATITALEHSERTEVPVHVLPA
jgi:hypothetical protein